MTAWTGRWTGLLVVAAVAWLCAAPGAGDAVGVSSLLRDERRWINAGAHVLRVQGTEHGGDRDPIPAASCEALNGVTGVTAAFWATRDAQGAHFTHVPGGEFSLVHVSPSALTFLGVAPSPDGVALVTDGLARRTGVTTGSPLQVEVGATPSRGTETSPLLRARIVSAERLGEDYDGALLVPAATETTADTCFVLTDAGHHDAVAQLAPSVLAWDGRDAVASPRLFEGEFTVDYTHAYAARDLRWAWLPSGGAAAMLWMLLQWFRRSHTAIYATFGMRASSRVMMETVEWMCLAAAGAVWGWSMGVAGALAVGAGPAQALTQVSTHTALTVSLASVLVVLIALRPTGSLLDGLKDR